MRIQLALTILLFFSPIVHGDPMTIDMTRPMPAAAASPYGPGATKNPKGEEITVDNCSFFLNGKPWIPIAGEFHYSRYPREEWRDALLKMKAGGINTVSTYVFWIHHEEEQSKFTWDGPKSLRDFLKLCQELDLKVFVRMGPWCHGEVRNGGFPDWVQHSKVKLRSTDPGFMQLVEPLYREEAKQMEGLLWENGGPVIGVQVDNECRDGKYLLALKALAQSVGVDVPYYAVTGWQGGVPREGLIPLFGGYVDGFWGGTRESYRNEYLFHGLRALNDLGAQLSATNPSNSAGTSRFPYVCVEIGGGMMSSYARRIKVMPDDIAALALSKLGSGNNMPGYYMYQGGMNPEGKLSYLQEDHPNQMPVKDYDFQTALGACGQVREQYHLLRQQHLFLEDFGSMLARMPACFPDQPPANAKDFETLRWDLRSDGKSGFLFFNNQQPYEPLPDHKGVQFSLKTSGGTVMIPKTPIDIPSGSYGFWPVNMDCDGVRLDYATVQPICRLAGDNETVYVFTALDGIKPELVIEQKHVDVRQPGTERAVAYQTPDGKTISFVVLSGKQGKRLWRGSFAGRERAILCNCDAVIFDGSYLRLQSCEPRDANLLFFPPLASVRVGDKQASSLEEGVFSQFAIKNPSPKIEPAILVTLQTPAGPRATNMKGGDESTWDDAAVYRFTPPASAAGRHLILNINYTSDAARLYIGDKLFLDNFYNGDPMPIPLWRIPADQWPNLRLKVLPYSDALLGRLPEQARDKVQKAKAAGTLNDVTISTIDQVQLVISPN